MHVRSSRQSQQHFAGRTATTLMIKTDRRLAGAAFIRVDLTCCNLPTTAGADAAVLTVSVTGR